MPMPSLFKYFAFVGAALLGLMTLANFLLDPATVTTTASTPKPVIVVQHDPRASKVERWRNEQAALKAAAQTQTGDNASLVTKSEIAPPPVQPAVVTAPAQVPAQVPAQAQPVVQAPPTQAAAIQAEPALQTADASAEHDAEAAHAAELARAKAEKAKAAKAARKAKLARDRARHDQMAREASQNPWQQQNQWSQNQWQQGQNSFFGQRTASSQQDSFYYSQRGPREAANAYTPRPSFGPFGGFGRGW